MPTHSKSVGDGQISTGPTFVELVLENLIAIALDSTVNFLYIELGYNEITAYIEVNILSYNLQTVNITTL